MLACWRARERSDRALSRMDTTLSVEDSVRRYLELSSSAFRRSEAARGEESAAVFRLASREKRLSLAAKLCLDSHRSVQERGVGLSLVAESITKRLHSLLSGKGEGEGGDGRGPGDCGQGSWGSGIDVKIVHAYRNVQSLPLRHLALDAVTSCGREMCVRAYIECFPCDVPDEGSSRCPAPADAVRNCLVEANLFTLTDFRAPIHLHCLRGRGGATMFFTLCVERVSETYMSRPVVMDQFGNRQDEDDERIRSRMKGVMEADGVVGIRVFALRVLF